MSELPKILAYLVEKRRIRNMMRDMAEAVQKYREELNPVQYPLLKNVRFDSWQLNEDESTIEVVFHENWDGGGSRLVTFPVDYLDNNWRAVEWAEDNKRRSLVQLEEMRVEAETEARRKRDDLAELKRLKEKYPDAE